MSFVIDEIDFKELESERYWSFPKSYKKDPKIEVRNMIFSGTYLGARKMDGAYFRFIKGMDGEMRLQGRSRGVSGEYLDKLDHVPHLMDFFNWLPNGTCLLGEIYFPDKEGSNEITKIMGCLPKKAIERQKDHPVHYYIFDIWAFDGDSYLDAAAACRFDCLKQVYYRAKRESFENVDFATYYKGEELWNQLQTILANGGEGVVITQQNSCPEPGKRTARKTLKIKKELQDNLDVVVMGANSPAKEYTGKEVETWAYWLNEKTGEKINKNLYKEFINGAPCIPITKSFYNNFAGSLKIGVYKDGKLTQIGSVSGLTEEILGNWRDYIGKVMEVAGMEVLKTGGIRHPKFVKFREDKDPKDCRWEDIYGK